LTSEFYIIKLMAQANRNTNGRRSKMYVQEQEEQDFIRMSPYEFEAAAVQQEGANRASQRYLLTNFDTWVLNPFWDGVDPSHPEDQQYDEE
tara:strand:+ start:164 stop:436 length:273 start_codon:yes stop_codon:yes gene_type:complete